MGHRVRCPAAPHSYTDADRRLLGREPAPIRIFHDVGELESSNTHSRWLDQVLTGKGYDTIYREFAGGHDYAWWRGLFADALHWCFPLKAEPEASKHG